MKRALGGVVVAVVVAGCALNSSTSSTGGNVNSAPASSTPATTTQTTPAAPQTFTGNGTENLGTIHVPTDSKLTWQCSGCSIMTIAGAPASVTDLNAIDVLSYASSGQSEVAADTYPNVQVGSDGSWTITITANG